MEERGSSADSDEDAPAGYCAEEGHKSPTTVLAKRPILQDVDVFGSKVTSQRTSDKARSMIKDRILGEPIEIEAPEEIPYWMVKGQ